MKPGNELIRHGAIVLAGTLGANVLGYVFHFSMSRLLGVSGYGSMLSLLSLITIVSIPALVAQTIVAKTIASYADGHRNDRIRRFVRFIIPSALAIAIAVALSIALLRGALASFLHADGTSGVLIVAWCVAFYLILPVLYGILQGDQRFHALAIATVCDAVLRASAAIVLVSRGFGENGAVLAIAFGATLTTVVAATFVSDFLRSPDSHPSPTAQELTFRSSLRVSGGILAISILASIDVVLVKHFRSAYEAGLFGSLSLIGRVVYLISNFVPTIILPKATVRISEGRSPVPLLLQAVVVFLVALSTILIPLLAAPALVLRIVAGNAYASAAPLLALYGSAIAFLAAAYAAANYNIGINRLGFVVPVIVVGCGEVVAIALRHDSLLTIVTILAVGHFLIFLATVFRMWEYADNGRNADALVSAGLIQSET